MKDKIEECFKQYRRGLILRRELEIKIIELLACSDNPEDNHYAGVIAQLLQNYGDSAPNWK